MTFHIDANTPLGPMKPLHGVGGGPVTSNFNADTTEYFRMAGIPFSRTHDIEYPYGSGEFVDIHCIFPNFDADAEDPKSYNFTLTDAYLKAVAEAGTEVFYRLGSTIEHQPIKRYIFPPKDNLKWAQICEHIIRHYNEGWADGLRLNIRFWEIWNEPDLKDRCWTGTHEEFFALYTTAATHLKSCFPELSIGGCAITSPFSSMTEPFLKYVREHNAPLDFFSWHGYLHLPAQAAESSQRARELLDKYGFTDTLSVYDEWNYVYQWDDTIQKSVDIHPTGKVAALCASVLCTLQRSRTDMAMYYDTQLCMPTWNGFFSVGPMHIHGEPRPIVAHPPFYSFVAYNALYQKGTEVSLGQDIPDVYAIAAADEKEVCVLLAAYWDEEPFVDHPFTRTFPVTLSGAKRETMEAFLVDEHSALTPVPMSPDAVTLRNDSVLLLRFCR